MDREIMAEIKKLSDRVQYLEDQLVKQRRENANLMEELDASRTSGISSSFVGAVDKKFSEIMQTEEKIQMTVADVSDEAKKQYSKYEQTAEKVAVVVADIEENVKQSISEIEATAKDISFKVGTYWYAVVNVGVNPEDIDNKGALSKYTDSLITYKNQNYYYNDITDKWQKTDSDSITSQFLQTANGFKLNGDVLIDGNTFVNGEFSTAVENSINVKIVGGSIIFYTEGNDLFKLERTDAGYMQMYIRNGWELGFSGEFDFSAANVTGLYAVFE